MVIDFTSISSVLTGIGTIIIPVWIVILILSFLLSWLFNGLVKGRL